MGDALRGLRPGESVTAPVRFDERPEAVRATIDESDPDELLALIVGLRAELKWEPQAHQLAPVGEWWTWVFQGGRGTGKSDAGAYWLDEHMEGPACDRRWPGGHKAIVLGPTHGDAVASCVKGVSGLKAHNPEVEFVGRKDGSFVIWPNGAEAVVLGMHTENDAERLRAQSANVCAWWVDEAAIGRHLGTAVDNLAFGARGGVRPHGIMTTTPKSTPAFKRLLKMPGVVRTTASSYDNRFLPEAYRELISHYEGTRLGRQEIYGELVDDYEGALWLRELIDEHRITDKAILDLPPLEQLGTLAIVRSGVGIDPSTWIPEIGAPAQDDEPYESGAGVETGIVVAGIDRRNPPHVYVFDDLSGRMAATKWAARAAGAYHEWNAAWVVPETNAGGDLVLATIHLTDPRVTIYRAKGSTKPGVRAAVGKRARAEPVAALWDQGRGHMVGEFPALESTLCGWDPTEPWSPDRLDALVWAVTALEPWKRRRPPGAGTATGGFVRA